ncbi:MAG: HAD family phosphatase [bacterium]|nr:HAD family phosphatase [bacterium]
MAKKNIIFDLGMVLVDFYPEAGMRTMGLPQEVIDLFLTKIFADVWLDCDRIAYDEAETRALFKKQVPGYEKEVDTMLDNITKVTETMPYTEEWLLNLKERGYRVYILSNYGKYAFETNSKIYEFLKYADGAVISYQIEEVKPEPPIYHYILDKYDLKPEECVFLDDREENIAGAKACGIDGIVFESFEQASEQLEQILREE